MESKPHPIGGEPYYSPLFLLKKPKRHMENYFKNRFPGKCLTYTYGGYYSLRVIIETLECNTEDKVLVPSYMCPSILIPFKEYGVLYEFYKVDRNLSIDINDLERRIDNHTKAILFLDYFGFHISPVIKQRLLSFKSKGILLLQDAVQDFYIPKDEIIGDYVFTSFRKFFPIEGSVIISDKPINFVIKAKNKEYFWNKIKGRFFRYLHYKFGTKVNLFLNAFEKAHAAYYSKNHVAFTQYDRYVFNRLDIESDQKTRKKNFVELLKLKKEKALYQELPDSVTPLAFPIVFNDRNTKRKELMKQQIFCPIHWILSEEVGEEYMDSIELSNKILSIPIQSNYLITDYLHI